MTVSPEILRQVKAIELRTRGLVGTLFAGEYRSVFRGQGMEFAEVRAYEHGDDFRAIDWNVSARLGSPYVKTFTEERELTLMLVVDQSGSARFGEPMTFTGDPDDDDDAIADKVTAVKRRIESLLHVGLRERKHVFW